MNPLPAQNRSMHRNAKPQYTIRSVPPTVDRALRERARRQGKSINEVALEALRRGVGLDAQDTVFDDLDKCIGTWQEDPDVETALKRQDRVDRKLWR